VFGRGAESGVASYLFEWLIGVNGVPTKKQLQEANRLWRTIDWTKYDAMSDEQIRRHWAWDKDMTWPTDKELAEFDLVIPATARRSARKRPNKRAKAAE
jgi:hypothetical protein